MNQATDRAYITLAGRLPDGPAVARQRAHLRRQPMTTFSGPARAGVKNS